MKSTTRNTAHSPPEEALDSARDLVRGWDRFWFTPSDPTTLGLIRLLGGLVLLYSYACYSYDLLSYLSPKEAWMDQQVVDVLRKEPVVAYRDYFPNPRNPFNEPDRIAVDGRLRTTWSIFFHLEDPRWIWTAHILILVSLFMLTIGFATRITSVIAFLGVVSYSWRAFDSLFGLDAMAIELLFYLMVAPSGATLSVDRWLEVRRERRRLRDPNADIPVEPSVIATIATRLIQIQFCFIYIAAGTSKLLGSSWWGGTALWSCYANYMFAPMRAPIYMDFLVFLSQHRWLWEIFMSGGVLFTLFVELGFPFLIWMKRWRWLMLCCSVLLHTGIGLFMGLATFSLAMLCLVLAFVPPEATKLFLSRVAENCRRLKEVVFGTGARENAKPLAAPVQ